MSIRDGEHSKRLGNTREALEPLSSELKGGVMRKDRGKTHDKKILAEI
jgi:hypothetical protein